MSNPLPARLSRRTFLGQAAASTAGVVTAGLALPGLVSAIEPIKRPAGHEFKFSLAAYSYRDLLTGKAEPKLTLSDFITDCAKLGLDGTELTSYYFPNPVTPEYLRQLKGEAFRLGLDVSGTAVGNDFCHSPGPEREKQIASVKSWIERADQLDAPVIRIFSGNVKKDQTLEQAQRLAVEAIEECCDYAGKYGVYLALENHGGLTEEVAGILALVKAVKSPWFGVNLDTGNFHTPTFYEDLAKLAPYAINVQVKVVVKVNGQEKQPTDYSRLATMLRESGYRGYIVLEYEEAGDPRKECAVYMDKLREAFV